MKVSASALPLRLAVAILSLPIPALAAGIVVHGTVLIDAKPTALARVIVTATNGMVEGETNPDGSFSLTVPWSPKLTVTVPSFCVAAGCSALERKSDERRMLRWVLRDPSPSGSAMEGDQLDSVALLHRIATT